MKKVIIIGGGIAGLTAAIYAQQKGFSTEIYEKNPMVGGECTGWDRQGYHVDNCIHWLTGCRPEDDLYSIWRNIGAIDDSTEFYREPYMYKLEMNGKSLHFWRDLEKARAEFLSLAPEDSREINKFFNSVKKAESLKIPCEKSQADMSFIEFMRLGMSMKEMGSVMQEYGQESVDELAQRFKNPYVQNMMARYFNKCFLAYTLITSYAFYSSRTGAIPIGGSVGMVKRIRERYENLGGRIHTNMAAVRINTNDGTAQSVAFADGSTVSCDYIICAADTSVIFGKLLDEGYMDKMLRQMYTESDSYRVTSIFNASFGLVGESDCPVSGAVIFPCEAFDVAAKAVDFMGIRVFDYDDTLFPRGRHVVQCSILQDESDYDYWMSIYEDKERYNAEKQRIAEDIEARIIQQYPELCGRLKLLSTYSPMTFTKWCGAYKGAYMSFYEQKGAKSLTAKCTVKGLSNVFIASQWLTTSGGLPMAATSGKFAAEKMASVVRKGKRCRG